MMVQNTDERQAFCGTSIGLAFLTTNTVLLAYQTRHDPWTLAFVLFAYLDVLALFGCLRAYEKQRAEPLGTVEMNTSLKVAIWVLANALNVAFVYRVAQMMPLALYAPVWGMSGFTLLATFYGLFQCPESENLKNNDAEEVLFSEFSPETKV